MSDRFPFAASGRLSLTDVTEIPEHLLKRSQAAKAKAAGEPAPADGAAPAASSAPAVAASASPAAGYYDKHYAQQKELLTAALGDAPKTKTRKAS